MKNNYLSKMNDLIADCETYKLEKKDQNTKTQNKCSAILKGLFQNNCIDEKLKNN